MGSGEVTPVIVPRRLLIQCRISYGQSDLTQPEIHVADFISGGGLIYSLGGLEPPSPWLAVSLIQGHWRSSLLVSAEIQNGLLSYFSAKH